MNFGNGGGNINTRGSGSRRSFSAMGDLAFREQLLKIVLDSDSDDSTTASTCTKGDSKTIDISSEVKEAKAKKSGKNFKKTVVVVKSKSVDKKAVNKPKLAVDKNVTITSWKLNKKAAVPDSHAILNTLEKEGYRKDLISAAKRRLSKLYKKNKSAPVYVGTKRHSKK
jgi:hypothetical protein